MSSADAPLSLDERPEPPERRWKWPLLVVALAALFYFLSEQGGREARDFARQLSDADPHAADAAALSLVRQNNRAAVRVLVRAASDPALKESSRLRAVEALSFMETPAAQKALENLAARSDVPTDASALARRLAARPPRNR